MQFGNIAIECKSCQRGKNQKEWVLFCLLILEFLNLHLFWFHLRLFCARIQYANEGLPVNLFFQHWVDCVSSSAANSRFATQQVMYSLGSDSVICIQNVFSINLHVTLHRLSRIVKKYYNHIGNPGISLLYRHVMLYYLTLFYISKCIGFLISSKNYQIYQNIP